MRKLPIHLRVDKVVCTLCGELITKKQDDNWNDEKAMEELTKFFPTGNDQDLCVVCGDCFKLINPENHPMEVALANLAAKMEKDEEWAKNNFPDPSQS